MNETDKPRGLAGMAKTKAMLDCGKDLIYDLIEARELDSFLIGKSRKVTIASIERLIAKRLAAGPGKWGDMRKVRKHPRRSEAKQPLAP